MKLSMNGVVTLDRIFPRFSGSTLTFSHTSAHLFPAKCHKCAGAAKACTSSLWLPRALKLRAVQLSVGSQPLAVIFAVCLALLPLLCPFWCLPALAGGLLLVLSVEERKSGSTIALFFVGQANKCRHRLRLACVASSLGQRIKCLVS